MFASDGEFCGWDRPAIRTLVTHTVGWNAPRQPSGQLLRKQLGALRVRVLRAGIPRANLEWVCPISIKGD